MASLVNGLNRSKSPQCVNFLVFGPLQRFILFQDFVNSILALDKEANIVIAGDFNEFVQTRSVFTPFEGIVKEIDESSGLDPEERYTYIFDQNCQQLVRATENG